MVQDKYIVVSEKLALQVMTENKLYGNIIFCQKKGPAVISIRGHIKWQ
jgi:hypothetical protein